MGEQVTIKNALLYPDSTRTLLSYRDIRKNELHIVTHEVNNKESLLITKTNCHTRFLCQNQVLIVCMTQDQLFHTYGQKCS
jgi:hypothetical protein